MENELSKTSGLSCGTLSQTTENILSFGNLSGSAKWKSLVTKTLFSDLENAANSPLARPLGLNVESYPAEFRNLSSSFFTFSSNRNLNSVSLISDDDVVFPLCYHACIMQGCLDVLSCEGCHKACDYLLDRHSSLEHLQDLPDHDSCALESRGAAADFAVRNDVFVDFDSHNWDKENALFKGFDEKTLDKNNNQNENKEKGFREHLTLSSLSENPATQPGIASDSRADALTNKDIENYLYINISNSIKNKEKTEFHNQVLQTVSAARTELSNEEAYAYINLPIPNHDLSKAGVAQSGTAADSDSAARTGLRVRNLGLESKSEVPSSSAQNSINRNSLNLNSNNEKALTKNSINDNPLNNKNNNQNYDKIISFFTLIPSAYAVHSGGSSYPTLSINGKTYALLTKEQVLGHSYTVFGVYYPDYNCDNLTGYWTVQVLTPGIHNQRFNFSGQIADAHNLASAAGGVSNGSRNTFVDDTDTDFARGNLSINASVAGTGAGANLTINISRAANQTQNLIGRGISVNASLIGYWRVEEGTGQYANDSGIYGNNGTLGNTNAAASNDPVWNSSTKFGSFGLSFDASNDYVNVSDRDSLDVQNFTVEAWIYRNTADGGGIVDRITGDAGAFRFAVISSNRLECIIGNEADADNQFVRARSVVDAIPATKVWYHVACVWNGKLDPIGFGLFVDGQPVAFTNDSNGAFSSIGTDGHLIIGAFNSPLVGNTFPGTIDEVRLWNITLGNDTILSHYQKGWGNFNT